jgi:hypothetical protein
MDVQLPLLHVEFHSFGYVPKSSIAGSSVVLFLLFQGTSILISMVAVEILVYIPTNRV